MQYQASLLSILIVSYNCVELLSGCIESVLENPPSHPFEIVLVDNGSKDSTSAIISARFPSVRLVDNTENLGFAGGNALAAAQAKGDLLLLLNPDTVVLPGSLDALIDALIADEGIWIAGACLLDAEGKPANAWGDFPSLGWSLITTAPFARLGLRLRSRTRMGMSCKGMRGVTRVGWVSGASLLIRRNTWDLLGGLSREYFMYFEETDLCYRVHQAGGDVVCAPGARIVHLEGGAVGQASTRQRVWFTEGLVRFLKRNRGMLIGGTAAVWIVLVNSLLWTASWIVGLAFPRMRRERKRYAALVRVGLGLPVVFDSKGMPTW